MNTPDLHGLLLDMREVQEDERQIAETNAQANLLIRREHVARARRFASEPITGFSPFHDEEPEMTADEIAADNHQDDLRWAAKEQD